MNKRKIIILLVMLGICLVASYITSFIYPYWEQETKNESKVESNRLQEYEKQGYQLVSIEAIELDNCDDMIKNDDASKDYQYSFYAMDVEGHIKEDGQIVINDKDIGHKMKTRIRDEYVIYIITEENYFYFANENKLISNLKISSILSLNKDGIEQYVVLFEDGSKYEFTLD